MTAAAEAALAGLDPDRAPVLPGGLAIMTAVFHALAITEMAVSDSALREGVLHEMVGRLQHHDGRAPRSRHTWPRRLGFDDCQLCPYRGNMPYEAPDLAKLNLSDIAELEHLFTRNHLVINEKIVG